jgi:excisionase family DNA binding protein
MEAAVGPEALLTLDELAQRLSVSSRRLRDRRWRARVGLRAILAGGSLRFDPADVNAWLEERRERFSGDAA